VASRLMAPTEICLFLTRTTIGFGALMGQPTLYQR
jgi:hypothetical protein